MTTKGRDAAVCGMLQLQTLRNAPCVHAACIAARQKPRLRRALIRDASGFHVLQPGVDGRRPAGSATQQSRAIVNRAKEKVKKLTDGDPTHVVHRSGAIRQELRRETPNIVFSKDNVGCFPTELLPDYTGYGFCFLVAPTTT